MTVLMGPDLAALAAQNFAAISASLVTIPGGTFMMGSEAGNNDEKPVREVTVSTFWMGSNNVTNEEYGQYVDSLRDRRIAVIGAHPATGVEQVIALGSSKGELISAMTTLLKSEIFPGPGDILTIGGMRAFADSLKAVRISDHHPQPGFDRSEQPAVEVNWYESFVYAYMHGCMLPTEWQYEYTARVVQGSNKLRGYATPSGSLTREEMRFPTDVTDDVDDLRSLALENKLKQMLGDVWQWMQNWYGPYSEGSVTNPTGPINGKNKSLRGGSCFKICNPQRPRAALRLQLHPYSICSMVGFRLAFTPQDSEN
jgi:sulfatase modifying factor 1